MDGGDCDVDMGGNAEVSEAEEVEEAQESEAEVDVYGKHDSAQSTFNQ